jgi:protein involved in polysaccharide export with SLBB domain
MRLADLLAAAGGAARSEADGLAISSGDLGGARLVRDGVTLPVSLEVALSGDPRHNIRVRAGDTLYVPADLHRLVSVLGQVGSPRVMPHRSGMRLTHALSLAGGVTRDGNWGDVRVIRGDPARPTVYSTSIADVVDGRAHDVVLAPGDIVYVASAGHADMRDVMNSVSALLAPLSVAAFAVPSVYSISTR